MKNEKILGMIPKVVRGQINYAMFISNKRVVVIKTSRDMAAIGGLLGGAMGAIIAQKYSRDEHEFNEVDLDKLINNSTEYYKMSVNKITEIKLKKELGVFRMTIFWINKRNKIKKFINCYLAPPRQQLNERVKAGEKARDVVWEYALEHQNMIEKIFGDKLTMKYMK